MLSRALFAADGEMSDPFVWMAVMIVLVLIIFFSFLALVLKHYKRCPSNRILVIYGNTGRGEAPICIAGGARLVMPLIQDYAWLSLEPMQIEIPLRGALSAERIRVNVPSVFTVAIGTSPELMQVAAVRLLGLSFREIEKQASEMITGELRQVISSLRIEEINQYREKLLAQIRSSVEPELRKIGLVLINVAIAEITDDSGYIEAIQRKAAAKTVQAAKEAAAKAERRAQLEVDFEGSVQRLVGDLLEQGKLSEQDRQQIRRFLHLYETGKPVE